MIPIYWDNGYNGDGGLALFDRNSGAVVDQGALDALMAGAGGSSSSSGGSSGGPITACARGSQGGETIELRVNTTTVGSWTLTTSYQTYEGSGSGDVRVYFTNDNGARDAQIDYVVIDGVTCLSEDQATNTGVWQNNQCGGTYSEWLGCNGYIAYTTGGSSSGGSSSGGSSSGGSSSGGSSSGGSSGGITIQENTTGFCGVDGSVDNNNAGYTGAGFANTDNASGNGIDWMANFGSSATYTFTFRYANGSSDRLGRLEIAGSTAVSSISFPGTGSWTTWSTVSANASVSAGTKTVRLVATGSSGLSNIDYILISVATASAASCSSSSGGTCSPATNISLPFTQNGSGNYCWFTTNNISYVNSWNTSSITINGTDFTNIWSNSMPAKIDNGYYISFSATLAWAHLEITAAKSSLANIRTEPNIVLYPNPTESLLNIDPGGPIIKIFDLNGKVVKALENHSNYILSVDLELSKGIYLVQFINDKSTYFRKFSIK